MQTSALVAFVLLGAPGALAKCCAEQCLIKPEASSGSSEGAPIALETPNGEGSSEISSTIGGYTTSAPSGSELALTTSSPLDVASSSLSSSSSLLPVTNSTSFSSSPSVGILDASGDHDTCPADTPPSCSAGSSDSCCYEGSNGLFLQTQFWDYNPATGPTDVWTIHGLWSDKCSGGYQQFCNPSWQISSATTVLQSLGLNDLVDEISTNWKNQGNTDDDLWTHEFNKHGTCMATVNPDCYVSNTPKNTNVGDFFKSVVRLWQTLPSYTWLSDAGIEPSTDKTWTVSEFANALSSHTNGHSVYLGCDRNNAINEIWYFFSLRGSVADGEFTFIDSVSTSSCTDGFKYLPKGSSGGGGGGGGGGSSPKGQFSIEGQKGCLISDGTWYASGTCATYTVAETIGGVSLTSSKGPCNIIGGALTCGSSVSAGDFELTSDDYLSYDGSTEWTAAAVAAGNTRQSVSPGGSGAISFKIKFASS